MLARNQCPKFTGEAHCETAQGDRAESNTRAGGRICGLISRRLILASVRVRAQLQRWVLLHNRGKSRLMAGSGKARAYD